MGGGNYTRDAPNNSVINVNDFPSVKALADHLTYLTENPVSTSPKCPVLIWVQNKFWPKTKIFKAGSNHIGQYKIFIYIITTVSIFNPIFLPHDSFFESS